MCPVCGGDTIEKEFEKLLRGGVNLAAVTVHAEVCLHCGERLYSKDTVEHFEQVRAKLSSGDVSGFERTATDTIRDGLADVQTTVENFAKTKATAPRWLPCARTLMN